MTLGFGAYRISNRSQDHKEALNKAFESGVKYIDTSANYTNGESELLIGEVLKESDYKPTIISKVGYIQGKNFEEIHKLNKEGKAEHELVKVDDHIWHSINPDFIENQITLTLNRLGLDCLDIYLLHNPEYYFYEEGATQEEYYRRIKKAFVYLESLVAEGVIKSYGISSNNFVLDPKDSKCTNIDKVYECAQEISLENNFKWIQFPFNILETGALERYDSGLNLLEKANSHGLKTMINRPLNAFKDGRLVRLATYESFFPQVSKEKAQEIIDNALDFLEKKFQVDEPDESIHNLPLIKQVKDIWLKQPSPDAIEQIFFGHLFPLVARVWGGDLSSQESQPFYDMYECSLIFARKNMNDVAEEFRKQAVESGLLIEDKRPLQIQLIDKYQDYGFDLILVGMKDARYVEQLKHYF
jgi:aryl-alcohol dehydrogenase-like predicted oxidoreductase